MGESGGAPGSSAAEVAESLRAQAEALLEEADRWDRGHEGEVETAMFLARLPSSYKVLHDRAIPGSTANIDHIVVGPTGAYAIDSKKFTHPVTTGKGTIWTARHPLTRTLETTAWEARAAQAALERAHGHSVPVTPVMCVHAPSVPTDLSMAGVHVVAGDALLAFLTKGPTVLTASESVALSSAVAFALPPKVSAPAPPTPQPVAPRPPSPAAPDPSTTPTPPPSSTGGTKPSKPTRQRPPSQRTRRTPPPSARADLLKLLGMLALAVFALTALPDLSSDLFRRMAPAPPAAQNAPSVSTVPAAPLTPPDLRGGTFSCPGRGRGWSFSLPWPGDQAGLVKYKVAWALAPEGAWIDVTPWSPGAAWEGLANISPGRKIFLRGTATGPAGDSPESAAMFTAPSTPC